MVIIRICGVLREHHGVNLLKLKIEADLKASRFCFRLRSTPDTAGGLARSVLKVFACRARWRAKGRALLSW